MVNCLFPLKNESQHKFTEQIIWKRKTSRIDLIYFHTPNDTQ